MTVGIIRVLTTTDEAVLDEHARLIRAKYGLECVTRCIPDQPHGVYDEASELLATPKIVALGEQLERDGCSTLIISCAADPALMELREAIRIPVIGAGAATARAAAIFDLPVAVLGITDTPPSPFLDVLGKGARFVSVAGVHRTTDLMTVEGKQLALNAADELYREGFKVIAFACTGFTTIGLAKDIRTKLGGAAVDGVLAAGMFAAALEG